MPKDIKVILKIALNVVLFGLFIYLIIVGQKNSLPVKWLGDVLKVSNVRAVGLSIMMIGLIGLLLQLYSYNKRYQN